MAFNNRRKNTVIVQSERFGAIVADVYQRMAFYAEHTLLDFALTRGWQPRPDGRVNYFDHFYDRNGEEFQSAVRWASEWIRKHPQAADEAWDPKAGNGVLTNLYETDECNDARSA